jgi:hypothetical protein
MRALVLLVLFGSSAAAAPTRSEFTAKLAKVKPGMTADQVKDLLGPPDDIKTEKDPGGITAARTVEVWRYGARAHLAFGTLGSVHVQADRTVQYVFGGAGTPYTGVAEPELRRLLETLDAVPSYDATGFDPLRLIRAVNALQPLGKDKALAVISEYLRVSSWLDDPGREGVFLVLRALFDVPAGKMPPMMVGGPSPAPPKDPTALPLYPIAIVDDVPLKIVGGYMLGGDPEPPEADVAAFRKVGTMRARPLAPTPAALDAIDAFVAGPLAKAMPVDDSLRIMLFDQGLRLFGTVYRPDDRTVDAWFPPGKDVAVRWSAVRVQLGKLGAKWDAKTVQFELPDGTTLPPLPSGFQRVWWDIGLAGTTTSRLTLERLSDRVVAIELRIELASGASVKADKVRLLDPTTGKVIATLELQALSAPANSTSGSVTGSRIDLAKGRSLRIELASGARGPTLAP